MSRMRPIASITATLTACVVTAGLAYGLYNSSVENTVLQERLDLAMTYQSQLQQQVEANTRQRLAFEAQLDALSSQLLESQSRLTSLTDALAQATSRISPEYEQLLAQARQEVAAQSPRRRSSGGSPFGAFSDPMMADSRAAETVPRMYSPYLNSLGIPGTERIAIMEAMVDYGSNRYQLLDSLLAGELAMDQAVGVFGAEGLANGMADYLDDEQLAALLEYDVLVKKDSARHVYGESLTRAGNALAGALFDQALETMLDEIYSPQNDYGALVAEDGSMLRAYNRQLEAYERARERLAPELDNEQMQHLDRFIAGRSSGVDVILEASTDGAGRISVNLARVGTEDLPN